MATLNLTAADNMQETVLKHLIPMVSDVLADKINNGVHIEKDGKTLLNKKDLSTFMEYLKEQAKKSIPEKNRTGAQSVCLHGDDIMGMAIHYFEEDSIEGKLYNQDGTEYKPPAPVKTTKPTPTPAIKPAPPPKPKEPNLFDMIDAAEKHEQPTAEPIATEEQVTVDETEYTADTEIENAIELQADDYEVVDNAASQYEPTIDEIADKLQQAVEQKHTPKPVVIQEQPKPTIQAKPKPKNELYEKYITYVNRHPDSVIAMRVGDFYEVFGKRAVALAEEVGLTLTGRDLGLEQRIPIIGFPYHAAEVYFKKIRQKHSVVVVENDGERKLDMFGIEDVLDGDDELTESEMRLFDGDIQEPKDIPTPESEQPKAACEPSDSSDDNPYDQAALAKVVKLLGNDFILR